ncbi:MULTISPECIES: putative sugar O-methyltransferase [Leptospira]|uniref:Sugar O-methyltransferase domain protein n=1 Tax=Leptospira noguchii serovar Panama str. CZ214 TaxID=1001595 RepID=T0FIZ1_9LEPT|nr:MULTISPECIES: putative sugar O-methyltransferase [Leptospira]EQA70039.1 sugar O-methyltransferase domain protein [Leptospira noguchii serovar Panama str. CZ214]MDI7226736.1 putative sugar O-methyltransferase [Leptospira santarosai]
MIFFGVESKKILIKNLKDDENVTSSHWKKYHQDFDVNEDGGIDGIIGFGDVETKYSWAKILIHTYFQRFFRKIAKRYSGFKDLDAKMSEILNLQNRAYSLDALRQTITLAFLKDHIKNYKNIDVAVVIGDGFASMASLLLVSKFVKKVVSINLSKTLFVDLEYFSRISSYYNFNYCLLTEKEDLKNIFNGTADFIAIQASNQKFLQSIPADLIINIASMQEMNHEVIQQYFEDMRIISREKEILFYCCNREEKTLPDGTAIIFKKYPWKESDEILIDELCSWHQEYYALRPPFYRRYDGPIRHRLVKLN